MRPPLWRAHCFRAPPFENPSFPAFDARASLARALVMEGQHMSRGPIERQEAGVAAGRRIVVDGNEAAASVAHRLSEVIAIYPITPSSTMGELADHWSTAGRPNVWGSVPQVVEMQSEAGAAGAVHGALQAGALATTFTASQGLLLMIPNMYKIAGELTPFCMHVAARTLATHALSIFGDHSDVMACRQTGFAMLASGSVQEAQDLAAVAHAATLEARVPFLHFFDGFRTSHEVATIDGISDEDLRAMVDEALVYAHRARALSPEHPVVRGTAQNPDTFFQAREAGNGHYLAIPRLVRKAMDRLADLTGRRYGLFGYHGHPEAERVLVIMGSGGETARETVEWLLRRGERVGVVTVHLYRPFSVPDFLAALPRSVRSVAVLDRTKEPGALGEPLYLDVLAALEEGRRSGAWTEAGPVVVGGRYGLSSKEFTPAMVKAALDELRAERPRHPFTVGIVDDVTRLSLPVEPLDIEPAAVTRAVFYGLGSDGTVGANKNSVKIIGEETPAHAQGYFVYDSKKSGAVTVSHLRFGEDTIRSAYLVGSARFVACHQFDLLERQDVLERAADGATFLLNAPFPPDEVWGHLPAEVQVQVREKRLRVFAIDAERVAREAGLGGRINTIMQACFFSIFEVLPREEAIARIKDAVEKSYGRRGSEVVRRNFAAVDAALAALHEVAVPPDGAAGRPRPPLVSPAAPDFVKRVTAVMLAGQGDLLPVSAFPPDGTWPVGTTQWEKRNIAAAIPVWDSRVCIQCNQCVFACPHAAIRAKRYEPAVLAGAPATFKSTDFRSLEQPGLKYTLQVAAEDCTGCELCVAVCPAKDRQNPRHKAINMEPQRPLREAERENYAFFLGLPDGNGHRPARIDLKESQFRQPLFEYSGACAGCGETPYVKLLTQLFGDRALIANATGCSSIYGGNLPTTPYTTDRCGRGPAWSNSLFEDNAEFGLGFRLALDSRTAEARRLVRLLAAGVGDNLAEALLQADQSTEAGIGEQRERVRLLRSALQGQGDPRAARLATLADDLVKKSVWLVGGDGWAYDIGFGGLDHVLASGRNVNVLVLDTEVYSNTGGQQSKATPLGAAAKFAEAGKETAKKDLGLLAMSYGSAYVASIAFGAKMSQTVQAFLEAESYPGPSLIIAYSHCIAHGYDMALGADQQKRAAESGVWPLYRFDPRRVAAGQPPLHLDSGPVKGSVVDYMRNEGRFRMVEKQDPDRFRRLVESAGKLARQRQATYHYLAGLVLPRPEDDEAPAAAPGAAQSSGR
jgi:pyruvate-ferredoxin/flavodoxin oxidoreductase